MTTFLALTKKLINSQWGIIYYLVLINLTSIVEFFAADNNKMQLLIICFSQSTARSYIFKEIGFNFLYYFIHCQSQGHVILITRLQSLDYLNIAKII